MTAPRRRLYRTGIIILFVLSICTIWTNRQIKKSSAPYLTDDIGNVPHFNVGLLLGTSQKLNDGRPNEFFYNRISATVDLYKNRKINYVLISGDHGTAVYLPRYSFGDKPVIFLNTERKALVSEYPTSYITSLTFFRPVSSAFFAASIFTR